jgi:Protein of unknown function (DUF1691)
MPKRISPSSPSFESMRELDPSPIDSPLSPSTPLASSSQRDASARLSAEDINDISSAATPTSSTRRTTTQLGLGLSLPIHPRTLQQLQKYSTYPFALFVGLHLTNTSLIPLLTNSLSSSDTLLLLTRPYYQSTALEPVVILIPLATHILAGTALRAHRRSVYARRHGAESRAERRQVGRWPPMSAQSALGYLLLPLLAGHVLVNRAVPMWVEGGSSGVGLRYVAHGFGKHPIIATLGYTALVGIASWHFVGGMVTWLAGSWSSANIIDKPGKETQRHGQEDREWPVTKTDIWYRNNNNHSYKKTRTRVINGTAAFLTTVWLLGGLGVVGMAGISGTDLGSTWEVRGWDEIYRRIPFFGHWL